MIIIKNILLLGIAVLFFACSQSETFVSPKVEETLYPHYTNFPPIRDNADNPMTPAKAELGKNLFFEKQLSQDFSMACASCHQPSNAFTSRGMAVSPTIGGLNDARNVPPLFNVGFYNAYDWDGHSNNLEVMIHGDFSAMTVFQNDEDTVIARLSAIPKYKLLYKNAFNTDNISISGLAKALAVFVRTIVSGNSKYDRYIRGDESALNETEKRGMELFMSDRTQCSNCHTPPLFMDMQYHNTGIATHYFDFGRFYVTGKTEDRGKFRTPTLRNIELTSPYMHDGELRTIDEVIEHYSHGGRPFINKSEFIKRRDFTSEERRLLKAFLFALTDSTLLNDNRYRFLK